MRAAIFIDGGYLLKRLQEADLAPDYNNLADFLLAPLRKRVPLDLMRCYFYYCPPWMSHTPTDVEKRRMASHEQFVATLQDIDRWQVRLGKLEKRRDGDREVFAQKRVDVQLSVDLARHTAAGHIQHAVILAGDSDFIPAIAAAKESGATVSVWCDRDTAHRDFMNIADEVQMIDLKSFPVRKAPSAAKADVAPAAASPRGRRPPRAPAKTVAAPVAPVEEQVPAEDGEPEVKKKRRRGRRGGRGRGGRGGAGGEGSAT